MWAVRPVSDADLRAVGRNIRPIDAMEVRAFTGMGIFQALWASAECSPGAKTLVIDGEPVAVYGAAPVGDGFGVPWLLGTTAIRESGRAFLAFSRDEFPRLIEPFGYLENFVHEENEASKRWLSWLGFTLEPAGPAGVHGEPFHRFWMRK